MSFNTDIVLGALLVATWANSVLYTIEITQAAYYYRHFKHDNWKLKLLVSSAIAIDMVSMIANYSSVYLYTITHWGDLAYVQNQYWFDPLYLFATGIMAALVQSFLAARYWFLTRNKFITLTLFFFITAALGGAFAGGITIAIYPEYTNREKATIPATTWMITGVVADISIASALLFKLMKAKSSFVGTRSSSASSLLNRLMAQTIQTGTSSASIALAALIAFLAKKESNIPTGIAYCLSRVYCITLLANLNSRKRAGGGPSSDVNVARVEHDNQGRSEGGDEYRSIQFRRTTVMGTLQQFSIGSFKPDQESHSSQGLPDDTPAAEIEMTVKHFASHSSKKKQDLLDIIFKNCLLATNSWKQCFW
ncbi:hypothetical protein DFH08DRAFT_1079061, partial [Mycena albidolilacea]